MWCIHKDRAAEINAAERLPRIAPLGRLLNKSASARPVPRIYRPREWNFNKTIEEALTKCREWFRYFCVPEAVNGGPQKYIVEQPRLGV